MAKRILIVEDEPAVQLPLKTILADGGYEMLTADDGGEGLEIIRKEKPDLVILDILLPSMNGLDVLSHMKRDEATKHIPVVILTNVDRKEEIERARSLGAIDYLTKSTTQLKDVKRKVAKYLEE